ncbi:DNA-J related domain-containing protein [Algibacillus agarilyticus]|uniref:DNA-J related domain-containing protein n=1 Tax=Algibacillus agarilyticus TaxID=2234133 RepID=UPI000DD0CB8B|nr:DNA-J related domain-containing protein [Algibacillus agarilyticus]
MFSAQLDMAIEALLKDQFGTHSELDLIKILQAEPFNIFVNYDMKFTDELFKIHFALYNAIYRLRTKWLTEQVATIEIKLSRITISPYQDKSSSAIRLPDPLQSYYLDWSNFSTSSHDVDNMLEQFWRQMTGHIAEPKQKQQALSILGLSLNAHFTEIKKRYKSLCMKHHPDRGGKPEEYRTVQWAWGILQKSTR